MGRAAAAFGHKPPRHAPKGTAEGGQFIGPKSVVHALIRKLLGAGEGGDGRQASAMGRFTSRGGSVVSVALSPRRPRIDDRVRDPHTGKLGTVQTMHPDGTGRVAWDDGRVESRHLAELADPHADRQLPDPRRTFDVAQGPLPAQVDAAVTAGTPGRPRSAAERMRDALAAGRVDNDTATRLMRGESPVSIVDSRSPAAWRDAQRAKLSITQRDALNGLGADQQELYWLRRAAGQDHDTAIGGVGAGPAQRVATQWGMATKGPLRPAQRGFLGEFGRAAPRSKAIYHSDSADAEELRARGLITINARNGTGKLTARGQRELDMPGSSDPGVAPAKKAATAAQRMSRAAKRPTSEIAAALRSATTREEADAHLQGLTVANLDAVADDLGIPRSALRANGSRKEDIRRSLVDIEAGGRLQFAAMVTSQSGQDYRPPRAAAKMARGKASRPRLTPAAAADLAEELSRSKPSREQLVTRLAGYNKTELASLARAHNVEIPPRDSAKYKTLTADALRASIIDQLDDAYRHPRDHWR